MKPEEDAIGQELWAYYNGKESFEIIERDDGYIDARFNISYYFSGYDDWMSIEKKSMVRVKGRVLDIGCGAGRHALHLQERGFDVLGIDISPLAIEVCKLRGLKKAEVMPIDDVRFGVDSFDTILLMGNNFGLLSSFKKAQRLLKRLYKMTSGAALIIASTRDIYRTDNPAHLEYHEFNKRRGRLGGQMRIRVKVFILSL